jgi:hypothetical protein
MFFRDLFRGIAGQARNDSIFVTFQVKYTTCIKNYVVAYDFPIGLKILSTNNQKQKKRNNEYGIYPEIFFFLN